MPNTLRATLDSLAQSFANGVLAAIRSASLEDLLAESSSPGAGRARPARARVAAEAGPSRPARGPSKARKGRLARRSPADIAKALAPVVALLKTKKAGLRSEEIQKALGLDKREIPRVLQEGLTKKVLKRKGKKRSTVYSVA